MEIIDKPSRLDSFYEQSVKLIKSFLFLLAIFFIFRLVFILRFGEFSELNDFYYDLLKSVLVGFRFDAQVIAYGLAGVFLLNFVLLFKSIKAINRISVVIISIVFSVFGILLIFDQQFYSYFQSHLNILAFGIIEDDTTAVLKSFWLDHPVVRIAIVSITLTAVLIYFIRKIYNSKHYSYPSNRLIKIAYLAVLIISFSYVLRGSFGEYPLQIDDSTVSDNVFINTVTVNGIFTLNAAIAEKGKSFNHVANHELLLNFGYNSLTEVFSSYYEIPDSEIDKSNLNEYFFRKTNENDILTTNPPHIIVFVMENMSSHFLKFHSDNLNLLGKLENHFNSDIVFNNSLSATNWTIGTLEYLILSTPYQPITSTKYRFKSFKSSVAYTYKQAGYETTFVYGGKIGWRNMKEFIPKQYFDNTVGKSTILKTIKGSRENDTWGVYDEYLFEYVYEKLEKSTSPQLFLVMTSTNHTPYEIPFEYQPYNLDISGISDKSLTSPEIVGKALLAYQYSNDCAGDFMDKLKDSELSENTIVVITGDHNSRALFSYDNISNMTLKYGVPLYFYIPEKYKSNLNIDTSIYTSHKDIFPTLFNLSLSNKRYFGFGENLFDTTMTKNEFYSINSAYTAFPPSADTIKMKAKINAISAIKHYYFNQFFD